MGLENECLFILSGIMCTVRTYIFKEWRSRKVGGRGVLVWLYRAFAHNYIPLDEDPQVAVCLGAEAWATGGAARGSVSTGDTGVATIGRGLPRSKESGRVG